MRNNLKKKKKKQYFPLYIYNFDISTFNSFFKFWFNCVHLFFSSSLYLFYSRIPFPPSFNLSFFLPLSLSLSRIYVIIYIHILYTIIYIQRIFIRDLTTNVALKKEKKKKQRKRRKRGQIMYAYKEKKKNYYPDTPFNIHTHVCMHLYILVYMYVRECMRVYILYIYDIQFL